MRNEVAHRSEAIELVVYCTHSLLNRFLERTADRHDFANALHAAAQHFANTVEFLQVPARDLDDAVVQARLEACTCRPGDRVADSVERDAEAKLCRNERERIAGRLAREGRRTRKTCVDLNDAVLLRVRVERVLDVALSNDAKMADNVDRRRAQHVIVGVAEGL